MSLNEIQNSDFPFNHYSVNWDYDYPITYRKVVHTQDELDEINEDCELYGYTSIDEVEFNRLNKAYPNKFYPSHSP